MSGALITGALVFACGIIVGYLWHRSESNDCPRAKRRVPHSVVRAR